MTKRFLGICFLVGVCMTGAVSMVLCQQKSSSQAIPRSSENSDVLIRQVPMTAESLEFGTIRSDWKAVVNTLLDLRPTRRAADKQANLGSDSVKISSACPADPEEPPIAATVLIVHHAEWDVKDQGTYTYNLSHSLWYTYRMHQKTIDQCLLRKVVSKATGEPMLYGDKAALFLGINHFSKPIPLNAAPSITYKVSATPGQAENVQALGALAAALVGATIPSGKAEAEKKEFLPGPQTFVAIGAVSVLEPLPFDFNISPSVAVKNVTKIGTKGCENSEPFADATVGTSYQARILIKGIKDPAFELGDKQSLPEGLELLGDGTIQGIPTKAAATCFKVIAIQKEPPTSIGKVFSITVSQSGAGHGGAAVTDPPADAKDNSKSADTSKQTGSTQNAPVDCSAVSADKPCTFTHTVHSLDREWWDVSLAVAIPGVREPKYSASNPAAAPSSTRHTDLYAMLDLYPAARSETKDSGVPHVLFGLPVTGQPFYRPFFGLGENFTGWTGLQRLGFPLWMSLFFGIVDMHQEYVAKNPVTTAGQPALVLKPERVWKPMFGIELPVSALVSKIGGKSKAASK